MVEKIDEKRLTKETALEYVRKIGEARKKYFDYLSETEGRRGELYHAVAKMEMDVEFANGVQVQVDIPKIDDLLRRKNALMNENVEKGLLHSFNVIFRSVRSQTVVVYDGKKEGELRNIVVGAYGFGLRDKINASRILRFEDIRYIYKHRVAVVKSLREMKLDAVAVTLEEFFKSIPDLDVCVARNGLFVPLKPVECLDAKGMLGTVEGLVMRKREWGSLLSLFLLVRSGNKVSEVSCYERGFQPRSRILYELVRDQVDDALEVLKKRVDAMEEEFKDGVQQKVKNVFQRQMFMADV